MNAEISEIIKAKIIELGLLDSRDSCETQFRQVAMPTVTLTNSPKLWLLQF